MSNEPTNTEEELKWLDEELVPLDIVDPEPQRYLVVLGRQDSSPFVAEVNSSMGEHKEAIDCGIRMAMEADGRTDRDYYHLIALVAGQDATVLQVMGDQT
ncbi:hypothetical protein [Rosistilla oblonga]|uniref:Uncharacterized protein n=1 Tax=Rosistilla oblonga TaxID=2527990 RepID=A0A518IMK4_9BACT|nr:hypothetical protein [Rosistilla oblonga]QDV54316.1 hypothetical protein Mal33_02660 [Rosistilla oblonga]